MEVGVEVEIEDGVEVGVEVEETLNKKCQNKLRMISAKLKLANNTPL